MNMTFDLAEIEEMPQLARKQLETELETNCCSLGGVHCLYTAVLVSPVQSSPESRCYRDPKQPEKHCSYTHPSPFNQFSRYTAAL